MMTVQKNLKFLKTEKEKKTMFLSNKEAEQVAERVIAGFLGERKNAVDRIDIAGLARNHLDMPICYETFAGPDANNKGYLSDGKRRLCVLRNGYLQAPLFPEKTIVVNSAIYRDRSAPSLRFTIAHEVAHYIVVLYKRGKIDIDPRFQGRLPECVAYRTERLEFSEGRVDRLAATLLMPTFLVMRHYADVFGSTAVRVYGTNQLKPEDVRGIRTMGERMGVSYQALYIRLRDLNLFDYRPLEEYDEGNAFPDDADDKDIRYDKRKYHCSPDAARLLHIWQREFDGLQTKEVTCVICGNLLRTTDKNDTSHSAEKCSKCHFVGAINAAYFRKNKPRWSIGSSGTFVRPHSAAN